MPRNPLMGKYYSGSYRGHWITIEEAGRGKYRMTINGSFTSRQEDVKTEESIHAVLWRVQRALDATEGERLDQ